MFSPKLFSNRIKTGEEYLRIIDEPLPAPWTELRAEAMIQRNLPMALSLVHPQHWEEFANVQEVLGPRAFRAPTLRGTQYCSAEDYWGVRCTTPNTRRAQIVADHSWPYSFGGPTHVANIRWLCRRHNAVKSSDIHLYPWEGLWPDWLAITLDKVSVVRSRADPRKP